MEGGSGPQMLSRIWADEEVKALLGVWCESGTQRLLEHKARNKDVYAMISGRLRALGYQRDWIQCRVKVKNLKYEYKVARDGTFRGGPSHYARCMRFYPDMDRVMAARERQHRRRSPQRLPDEAPELLEGDEHRHRFIRYAVQQQQDGTPPPPLLHGMVKQEVMLDEDEPDYSVQRQEMEDEEVLAVAGRAETEGDSSLSSSVSFLAGLQGGAPPPPPAPDSPVPATAILQTLLLQPPTSSTAQLELQQQRASRQRLHAGPSTSGSRPAPRTLSEEASAAPPRPTGGGGRCRRGGRWLERVARLFLQYQRLSDDKFQRFEAHQRQLERLHELRLVTTIMQGFQGAQHSRSTAGVAPDGSPPPPQPPPPPE